MSNLQILAVLVLYKRSPEESESFTSLRHILQKRPELAATMSLLVYDNSPEMHTLPEMQMTTHYASNPSNPGLAEAYNNGLQIAQREGIEWLLLLDQDTLLTESYLEQLIDLTSQSAEMDSAVCAIVPKLIYEHRGRQLVHSPHFMPRLTHHGIDLSFSGVADEELSGYNSATTLRVRDMAALGGFSIRYPMEFLDHVTFHTLQKQGGKVWVMESMLQHSLSTRDLEQNVSLVRYKKILYAERDFHLSLATQHRLWYRIRRFKQGMGHLIKMKNKRFAVWDLRAAVGVLGKPLPNAIQI